MLRTKKVVILDEAFPQPLDGVSGGGDETDPQLRMRVEEVCRNAKLEPFIETQAKRHSKIKTGTAYLLARRRFDTAANKKVLGARPDEIGQQ